MRIERLKNYRSLCNEIMDKKDRLKNKTAGIVVSGSSPEFPYTKRSFAIEGVTNSEENAKLLQKIKTLEQEKEEIEDFVYSIEDSQTRRIFEYRYLLGAHKYTWQRIATIIGENDESYPRRIVKRFFEKNS